MFKRLRRGLGVGGRGESRPGRGRGGGPKAAGPGGDCKCPSCGSKHRHVVGEPCFERKCPKCGTMLTRE